MPQPLGISRYRQIALVWAYWNHLVESKAIYLARDDETPRKCWKKAKKTPSTRRLHLLVPLKYTLTIKEISPAIQRKKRLSLSRATNNARIVNSHPKLISFPFSERKARKFVRGDSLKQTEEIGSDALTRLGKHVSAFSTMANLICNVAHFFLNIRWVWHRFCGKWNEIIQVEETIEVLYFFSRREICQRSANWLIV